MLSKPLLIVSGGRNEFTSTSMPSRSCDRARVLGAIQALERTPARVRVQRRPRCRCAFRAQSTNAAHGRGVGTAAPGGGIMPARSLRIIFSATSACLSAVAASKPASTSPPALPFSLWQPAQVLRDKFV